MIALFLASALLLQDTNETAPATTAKVPTQVALNAIADDCMASRNWLKLIGTSRVRFDAPSKAPFELVSCVVRRIRDSGLPVTLEIAGTSQPATQETRR